MARARHSRLSLGAALLVLATTARAAPFEMTYGGRLTLGDGRPVDGAVDLRIDFFRSADGNDPVAVGSPTITGVALSQGLFQVPLKLTDAELATLLNGTDEAWVQVTDVTNGKTYPRQRFLAVPYALKVPVDGSTIGYDGSGRLSFVGSVGVTGVTATAPVVIGGSAAAPVVSLPQASGGSPGYLSAADWTAFNGKQAALGFTPVNKAGDTLGGALSMGGFGVTNLAAPVNPGDAATKAYADAKLGGFNLDQAAKADQYVVKWDNAAGKFVLGADQLGAAGGGIQSFNTLNTTAQTLALGTAGTAPAWVSSGSTHTLDLPLASAAGVTAGLLSKSDYDVFNGKQPLITAASTVTTGTLNLGANAHTIGLKAPAGLAADPAFTLPGTDGATGQVLKTDGAGNLGWVALPSVPVTSVNGQTGVVSLTTTNVNEGTNLYYTDTRSRNAVSATAPLSYTAGTGVLALPAATGSANGYLTSGDWTTFNGKQAALGFTPVNKAGDTMGGPLNMGGQALTNLAAPSVASDATTKTYVDTADAALLRKDGTIALTAPWNTGAQDITNAGNVALAAAKTLGLGIYATDPSGLTALDAGKLWFNSTGGQLRYWDGAAVKTVGAVGVGLDSLNGLSGATQTLATGTSGNAPAWTSSGTAHTLNIPLASAGGSVTAGLVTNADYVAFNAKQAAITAASTVNAGTVTTALQDGLEVKPYGAAAGNAGELRFDELAANGANYVGFKAPDLLAGNKIWTLPVADGAAGQVLKTDGSGNLSWVAQTSVNGQSGTVTLSTTEVAEGTNLYYTDTRARASLSATAPLAYNNGTGALTIANIANADVSATAGIVDTKLATIATAGKVSGGAITSGTIGGTTAVSTSGNLITTGKIGIGSATPAGKLDVAGRIRANDDLGGTDFGWYFTGNSGGLQATHVGSGSNIPLAFFTNSSGPRMTIDTSGRVGIGTTAPAYPLHVSGNGGAASTLMLSDTNAAANVKNFAMYPLNGKVYLQANNDANSSAIGLTTYDLATGNVGIGTTSPAQKLSVTSDGSSSIAAYGYSVGSQASGSYFGVYGQGNQAAGSTSYGVAGIANGGGTNIGGYFNASGGTSNYALLTGGGNVGIGTATPGSALSVNGQIESTTGGVKFPDGTVQTTSAAAMTSGIASARRLIVKTNTVSPASKLDITATEIVLKSASNTYYLATNVNVTADLTASGAGGRDTGAEAANTWYYVWLISNGSTVNSLYSTSATAPTLPGGYTYKALVSAVYNDSVSNFLGDYYQVNEKVYYTSKHNALSQGSNTAVGTVSIALFVPPIAPEVMLYTYCRWTGNANVTGKCWTSVDGTAGYIGNRFGYNNNAYATVLDSDTAAYNAPLVTPQTIYYFNTVAGADFDIDVMGFMLY